MYHPATTTKKYREHSQQKLGYILLIHSFHSIKSLSENIGKINNIESKFDSRIALWVDLNVYKGRFYLHKRVSFVRAFYLFPEEINQQFVFTTFYMHENLTDQKHTKTCRMHDTLLSFLTVLSEIF